MNNRRDFLTVGAATLSMPLLAKIKRTAGPQTKGRGRVIVITIGFAADGELTEQMLDSPTRSEMRFRFSDPQFTANLNARKRLKAEEEEDAIHHPNHTPWVIRPGDVLQWECDPKQPGFDFLVSLLKNDQFEAIADAPHNPFGWDVPQSGGKGRPVRGMLVEEPGQLGKIRSQLCYKFSIWAKGKVLDPDGYIGG